MKTLTPKNFGFQQGGIIGQNYLWLDFGRKDILEHSKFDQIQTL